MFFILAILAAILALQPAPTQGTTVWSQSLVTKLPFREAGTFSRP